MTPWFGLHLPNYTFADIPPERLFERVVEQARAADEAGFSLVTVMDHLYQIHGVGPETDPMLEAYAVLAALSQRTTRVRLGDARHRRDVSEPGVPRQAGDDARCPVRRAGDPRPRRGLERDGAPRLWLRLPADPRADGPARRGPRRSAGRCSRRNVPASTGRYYRIEAALNVPRPIQAGGPPIMVGGGGEQRTLKIAATHADMTHWFPLGLETLRHKTEVLRGHCEAIGRDPATIELTMATPGPASLDEAAGAVLLARLPPERRAVRGHLTRAGGRGLRPYLEAGFTGFTFNNPILTSPELVAMAGETLALIR